MIFRILCLITVHCAAISAIALAVYWLGPGPEAGGFLEHVAIAGVCWVVSLSIANEAS